MINPPVPKLTPADINKMILLNSASQPVMQLFHKPFLFEPSKLKFRETGEVAARTDPLQQYPYVPKRPRLDTYQFRHRLSSYIINGFELSESNNKLVVAPGKMNVFLPAKHSVAESYIEVTYSGSTIDLSIFASNPYNFPLPVVAYITTNGQNTLSLEVKVGVPIIEEHNHNKEYITLGSVFVSPSDLISVVDSTSRWRCTSEKVEDLVMATTPMQHNIIPMLDDQVGVKVLLGDHAAIYDRSVTPVDVNFLHTQFTPASQVRFTVLDSNGGYIKQAVGSAIECVVAGKLQDTLRNGSPTNMQTGQFALHPLFYSAGTDASGAPTDGILYMQIAQTVYDKPIGSQGLFFVEEWMLDESLGNFLRCDLIQNTAAFIGFFVCGEGVSTLKECEIIVANDFFSSSFKDPDPLLPKEGVIDGTYVTYHDGEYHTDGITAPGKDMGLIKGGEKIEPFLDFGANYRSFKLVVKFGHDDPTNEYPYLGELILYNKYYPDGLSTMDPGEDAKHLREYMQRVGFWCTWRVESVKTLNGATFTGDPFNLTPDRDQPALVLTHAGIDLNGGDVGILWGRTTETLKPGNPTYTDYEEVARDMMPVYFNFSLSVDGEPFIGAASPNSASQYEMGLPNIPNNASINYSFIRDSSFKSCLEVSSGFLDASETGGYQENYVASMGEHTGNYLMPIFDNRKPSYPPYPNNPTDKSPGFFGICRSKNGKFSTPVAPMQYSTIAYPVSSVSTIHHWVTPIFTHPLLNFARKPGDYIGYNSYTSPFAPFNSNIFAHPTGDKGSIGAAGSSHFTPGDMLVSEELQNAYPGRKFLTPGMDNFAKHPIDPLMICTHMIGQRKPIRKSIVEDLKTGIREMGMRSFTYVLEGGGYLT